MVCWTKLALSQFSNALKISALSIQFQFYWHTNNNINMYYNVYGHYERVCLVHLMNVEHHQVDANFLPTFCPTDNI